MALLSGKRLTVDEAARWVTTGAPRIACAPGQPDSGAALRAAALELSAKAIAIQAQRLKERRAARREQTQAQPQGRQGPAAAPRPGQSS